MQRFEFVYSPESEIAFFDSKTLSWELLCFPYKSYEEVHKWTKFKNKIKKSCVYIILISQQKKKKTNVYIGKSERSFEQRFNEHLKTTFKNFDIEKIFIFTSNKIFQSMDNLCDFETKFISFVLSDFNKGFLLNKNGGSKFIKRSNPEEYDFNKDTFLEMKKLFLFLLKDIQTKKENKDNPDKSKPRFPPDFNSFDYNAAGYLKANQEFVVLKDSFTRGFPSIKNTIMNKWWKNKEKTLLEKQVIKIKKQKYLFKKNYTFNSCSAAGSFVRGINSNGWTDWKNEGKQKQNLDHYYRIKKPFNPGKKIFSQKKWEKYNKLLFSLKKT